VVIFAVSDLGRGQNIRCVIRFTLQWAMQTAKAAALETVLVEIAQSVGSTHLRKEDPEI
jgi:hypothetical protein